MNSRFDPRKNHSVKVKMQKMCFVQLEFRASNRNEVTAELKTNLWCVKLHPLSPHILLFIVVLCFPVNE